MARFLRPSYVFVIVVITFVMLMARASVSKKEPSRRLGQQHEYQEVPSNSRLCVMTSNGITRYMYVNLDDHILLRAMCGQEGGSWEDHLEHYYSRNHVKNNGGIVEFGANVGYFTQYFANAMQPFSHLLAVEASPQTFALLHAGMTRNGGSGKHTELNAVLVPEGSGSTAFFCIRKHFPLNNMILRDNSTAERERCAVGEWKNGDAEWRRDTDPGVVVEVAAVVPSSLFPDDLRSYALVKVDTDWAEGVVWESLAKLMKDRGQRFPHITVETNWNRCLKGHMCAEQIVLSMMELYGKVGRIENSWCIESSLQDFKQLDDRGSSSDVIACVGTHILLHDDQDDRS